jgi:hypothetical protein
LVTGLSVYCAKSSLMYPSSSPRKRRTGGLVAGAFVKDAADMLGQRNMGEQRLAKHRLASIDIDPGITLRGGRQQQFGKAQ